MAKDPTRRPSGTPKTTSAARPASGRPDATEAVTPISGLSCPTTPYSFAKDIAGLFTQTDINCMSWAFNLASYDDVKANATAIYAKVASGQMPKPDSGEARWTPEMVTKFGCWVQKKCQP